MLVIDACRNSPEVSRSSNDNFLSVEYPASLDFGKRNQGIKAFATLYATGIKQRAYEYYEGNKRRGYFTSVFVEAISGAAANERGEITLASVINYLERVVPSRVQYRNKDRLQVPFSEVEGYRTNELVIAFRGQQHSATANVPLGPPPLGNSSSTRPHTINSNDLTFILERCSTFTNKGSGLSVECDLLVTNKGEEKALYVKAKSGDSSTEASDNFGNTYRAAEYCTWTGRILRVCSLLPLQIRLSVSSLYSETSLRLRPR